MADGYSTTRSGRWQPLLLQLCRQSIERLEVEHASIRLTTSPTEWAPGAASSSIAASVEEAAFTLGEGPCYDAMRDHVPVIAADLTTATAERRWPSWTRAAGELGVRSTAAFPVQAGALVAGVLTGYSGTPWQPTAARLAAAQALTDAALLILLDIGSAVADGTADVASADGDALAVLLRGDVHRAAGMVMAQAGVPIDQALALLRARAYASGRSLPDLAADVLSRRIRLDSDGR